MSVSPSRRFAYDHPVRRVHVLTNVTACCLMRGCIPILSTNRKRTGTWDPWRAVRSSRDKLVSEPLRWPGKRTRERIAASSKKTEYHHRVRGTHGDCCKEDRSTGGRLRVDRRRQPPRVAIAASLVGSQTIGVCAKKCKVQIWKEQSCVKTENVGDWKNPVQ